MMRLAAVFVLASACASAPASMPWVRVDRALDGAVCSRLAAETIAQRRAEERGQWQKKIFDCEERAAISDARAARAQWWERNAPWLIGIAGALGIAVGGAVGVAVSQ